MESILIIDDDDAIRRTLELHLREQAFEVQLAARLAEGRTLWTEHDPDIVVLDLMLPDGEGTALLDEQIRTGSQAVVIMVTGHQEMEFAVRAMKSGAFNYIHKPLDIDELDAVLARAVQQIRLRRRAQAIVQDSWRPGRIAGQSKAVLELHKQIGLAARSRVSVMITGESGTGKELVARAVHENSTPDQPFVAVNCSAIVGTLLESEMFGHERGAFTGATQRKMGRMELAAAGTLFLDEVADLSLELQAKLLRVLQERTFERVGGTATIAFAARVITATHRDLAEQVQTGKFREDLYFRLQVMEIHLPPLRDRREDIPELVNYLLQKINHDLHRNVTRIPEKVLSKLTRMNWPGNIRELENVLTQAALRSTGDTLTLDFLPEPPVAAAGDAALRSLTDVEREHIVAVLHAVSGNLGRACEVLGISRPTLRKKMEEYAIKER